MLDFSIMINSTEPSFKIRAFSEYCMKKQANYESVMALLAEVISDESLGSNAAPSTYGSSSGYVFDPIKSKIEDFGLNPESYILIQSGYIKLYDLVSTTIQVVNAEGESDSSFFQPVFTVVDAARNPKATLNYMEVSSELSASLHAMVTLIAANKAVQAESIADSLTIFRDEIQSKFQNSYADVSNTAATLKSILEESKGNIATYFANLNVAMSIEELAVDDSTASPLNDNFAKYSGASPSACLCSSINKAGQVVSNVINVAAKVVGGVLSGLFSIGKTLFNKAFNWIHQTVADPMDLKYSTDGEAPTIDGFAFERNDYSAGIGLPAGCTSQQMTKLLQPYVGSWLGFDTYYSSVLIRIKSVQNVNDKVSVVYDSKLKPKTVSSIVFNKLINASRGVSTGPLRSEETSKGLTKWVVNDAQLVYDTISEYATYGPDALNDSANEEELFSSLVASLGMTNIICKAAVIKNGLNTDVSESAFEVSDLSAFKTALGGSIRNCDFITVASGYHWASDTSNWVRSNSPVFSGNPVVQFSFTNGTWESAIAPCLVQLFAAHLYEESTYPVDYAFFPYTNNTWTMPASKWSVATDADNAQAFTKAAAAATLVIISLAVATTAAVVLKKIRNTLTKRALQRKSVLDQKMWNGETLTNKEWRQYKRANKRCNASAILSQGLQETSTGSSTASTLNGDTSSDILTRIKYSIVGE